MPNPETTKRTSFIIGPREPSSGPPVSYSVTGPMKSAPELSTTTKLSHADHRLLICLSEQGGWTAGEVARHMGYTNVRSEAQLLRRDLLRMEALGWVAKLDDNRPIAWVRTPAGTEALNA